MFLVNETEMLELLEWARSAIPEDADVVGVGDGQDPGAGSLVQPALGRVGARADASEEVDLVAGGHGPWSARRG